MMLLLAATTAVSSHVLVRSILPFFWVIVFMSFTRVGDGGPLTQVFQQCWP